MAVVEGMARAVGGEAGIDGRHCCASRALASGGGASGDILCFETAVGLENTLRIADQLPDYKLAIGFDTLTAFADGLSPQKSAPIISAAERTGLTSETIWKQLPI